MLATVMFDKEAVGFEINKWIENKLYFVPNKQYSQSNKQRQQVPLKNDLTKVMTEQFARTE